MGIKELKIRKTNADAFKIILHDVINTFFYSAIKNKKFKKNYLFFVF